MAKTSKKSKSKDRAAEAGTGIKMISDNRKARHDFHILDTYQAGIELMGTEVKSMRHGTVNLRDSFARIDKNEVWLHNMHVSPYEYGNRSNHEPLRKRRLLMHKKEILKIQAKMKEKGLTLVPLKIYFKGNWVKVDLALARGKRVYDKRQAIAKREGKRQLERVMKQAGR